MSSLDVTHPHVKSGLLPRAPPSEDQLPLTPSSMTMDDDDDGDNTMKMMMILVMMMMMRRRMIVILNLARGDHPNSWKNAPRMHGLHVGSDQFRESFQELLQEFWFSHCTSHEDNIPRMGSHSKNYIF